MFNKRYTALLLTLVALMLISVTGCSKDDSTGPETESEYLWVHFDGDSTQVLFDDLTVIDVTTLAKAAGENDGIMLQSFISSDLIEPVVDKDGNSHEARELYAYRNVGDDGFSAAVKGYADNTWEEMGKGYVMVDVRKVVFPDDILDLPGAYNVKDVRHIYTFRKFDIVGSDTTAFTSIDGLTVHSVDNGDGVNEDAVRLSDLVDPVLADAATGTFNLVAIDGYTIPAPVTYAQLQQGYWLLESGKTIFAHEDLQSGKYKVRDLKSIEVAQL